MVGWKLGATSPAMRRQAGHAGPSIGRVFGSVTFHSPAALPSDRPLADNFLGDDRCMPLEALAEAANILSDRGIGLHAGQYLSTGRRRTRNRCNRGQM